LIRRYSVQQARAKKAYDIVVADKLVIDKDNAKKLKIKDAEVVFDNVGFGYGDKAVLKKFNLNIKNGEKVGIVGLSGAGKTTLCNLLLRMYDVDGGAIKINGIDIRDVTQDSLRKNISFVPQESTLFNRSILENIRYARPGASKADVIRAAKKANIHEFIMSQPNGYNTLVGNNGIKLSGGQRQRVSIARALLKDAPILMLDEATSALDSENEMLIQKSLQHAMRGKTALVIAHRLSTLRNMDRIVVIKNGKIVESGSHKQLLRSDGAYRKLWDMQTGGSIGE
jgi:ABC-type multidrug transport system fused ATPase/permease subunit